MRRMLFVLGTGAAALVLFTFAPTGDASRLKASGTAIHDVSTTVAADRTPARLVFSLQSRSSEHGPAHVYVINADGSGRKALTRGPQQDDEVAPSPDGRWIAFMRYRETATDSVRVMRPDGRGGRRLGLSDAKLLVPRPGQLTAVDSWSQPPGPSLPSTRRAGSRRSSASASSSPRRATASPCHLIAGGCRSRTSSTAAAQRSTSWNSPAGEHGEWPRDQSTVRSGSAMGSASSTRARAGRKAGSGSSTRTAAARGVLPMRTSAPLSTALRVTESCSRPFVRMGAGSSRPWMWTGRTGRC